LYKAQIYDSLLAKIGKNLFLIYLTDRKEVVFTICTRS
jgi:hypothetical protein